MLKLVLSIGTLACMIGLSYGQECRCERYNYWVGSASNYREKGQINEAAKRYRYALAESCFPFGVDLDHALEVAILACDSSLVIEIATQLARGGVSEAYFNRLEVGQWLPRFMDEFPQHRAAYEDAFNAEMRHQFLDLIVMDSIFNSEYHQWRAGTKSFSKDDLISGARMISERFKALVREFGFPCEEKMGYYFVDGHVESFPVLPLMMHIYQRGDLLYLDHLPHMVCNGKLMMSHQAVLDHCRGFTDGGGVEAEMEARYQNYGSNRQ